ncbi:MAG: ABC transporter ATP-binding protein [bacterium]|nr:ABC transporter ATP-binding protein [bacterium]
MALIDLVDVKKKYRLGKTNELEILKGITLSIDEGEFVAIMGPSGSGKSTLMHITGFLDHMTSGSYQFDNKDVTYLNDSELARIRNKHIGFVFQAFNLLPRTSALENVRIPMMYARNKSHAQMNATAREMLERVGLGDRIHHPPSELSGGQQQRVAIARALINDPKVIFADEPTGNLDSISSLEIMDIFKELNKAGHTILYVTHEQKIAEYAGRVIRMHDGKVLTDKNK